MGSSSDYGESKRAKSHPDDDRFFRYVKYTGIGPCEKIRGSSRRSDDEVPNLKKGFGTIFTPITPRAILI
jgi:hypothetical protein